MGRLGRSPGAYCPVVPEAWPLPVDIRLVESFAVVAEELHFTRAAQRLSVSQPALSQQIARLERQLGVQLFTRSPGAVALTPAGVALWREVQPALAGLRAGIAAARAVGAGATGRLRVQHLSSYGPQVLPMVAAQLRETDPDLVVELREASVEEQLDALPAASRRMSVCSTSTPMSTSTPPASRRPRWQPRHATSLFRGPRVRGVADAVARSAGRGRVGDAGGRVGAQRPGGELRGCVSAPRFRAADQPAGEQHRDDARPRRVRVWCGACAVVGGAAAAAVGAPGARRRRPPPGGRGPSRRHGWRRRSWSGSSPPRAPSSRRCSPTSSLMRW